LEELDGVVAGGAVDADTIAVGLLDHLRQLFDAGEIHLRLWRVVIDDRASANRSRNIAEVVEHPSDTVDD